MCRARSVKYNTWADRLFVIFIITSTLTVLRGPEDPFFFFFITQLFRFPHEHTVVCQSQNGFYFTWEIFSFLSALFLAGLKWVGLILEKKNGGCCVFSSTNQDLGKRKSDEMTPTHF